MPPLLTICTWPPPGAAVLRAIGVQQHPDLGDRIEVDLLGHQAAVADFVGDHPVDDDVAPVAARAADVRHRRAEAHARASRPCSRSARPGSSRMIDVTSRPSTWTCSICVAVMSAAVLGLRGVDVRAACLDGDRLADAADLERQRSDRQALAGAEDDVLALERAEALRATSARVHARLQVGDLEVPLRVADRDARFVGGFGNDRHRGAGDDLPLRVGDRPGDGPGNGLGGRDAAAGARPRPTATSEHKRRILI